MGVYYSFYLEIKRNNNWILISDLDDYYLRRSSAYLFLDRYEVGNINYLDLSEELINKYNLNNLDDNKLYFYKNVFYLFDLDKMINDYDNDLHDYDGIISLQDYQKIISDIEYYPNIIKPSEFIKLPKRIQDNYNYYRWDDYFSEYRYLYELVPLIKEKLNNIKYDDVRIIVKVG